VEQQLALAFDAIASRPSQRKPWSICTHGKAIHGSDGHELLIDRLAGALSALFVEQRVKNRWRPPFPIAVP
jgi:hypothetical protein